MLRGRFCGSEDRVSYAPPVSGAELRSARVGVTLGRPVNAAVGAFFFARFFSFLWFYWLFLVFRFLFFFSFFFFPNFLKCF
jgi:hypothetical protein